MRTEKKICKERFEINGVLIGEEGDVLEITDATPREEENETLEDVEGYCGILNTTKKRFIEAIWIDIDGNVLLEDIN